MSQEGFRKNGQDESAHHGSIQQALLHPRTEVLGMLKLWSVPPPTQPAQLKEVVAIIRPPRWSQTKRRVQRLRLAAFTHTRVLGRGRERGLRYLPRVGATPKTAVRYLPKRMISWIVEEAQVEPLVAAIIEVNRTGHVGDGKIFVLPIEGAVRIRTGEAGVEALRAEQAFEEIVGKVPRAIEELADASRQ